MVNRRIGLVQGSSRATWLFDVANYLFLMIFAALCVMPIIHIAAMSLSAGSAVAAGFVGLWPVRFTTRAYQVVLRDNAFYTALMITVRRTVFGTAINMALTILTAYPLSKSGREFKLRDLFMWVIILPLLFSGGLVPWFLVIRRLGLLNSIWALILPEALPLWNVILLMNFFREVPKEIDEAAMMDGASHWRRLENIYLPYSTSALATLTLFAAVNHWNAWFDGMVLMWDASGYPLQTLIRVALATAGPSRTERAALVIVGMLPILAVYPFLQRYFVQGIRLGALKG
jgi:putative aldouronate transport system permease protein